MLIKYILSKNKINFYYLKEKNTVDVVELIPPQEDFFIYKKTKKETEILNFDDSFLEKVRINDLFKLTHERVYEILYKKDINLFNEIFKYVETDIIFIDIEVEVIDGFPNPSNPKSKILTISCVLDNKAIILGLKSISHEEELKLQEKIRNYLKNNEIEIKYFAFKNESDMLFVFFKKIYNKFVCFSGWNFLNFDWYYILNRALYLNLPIKKFVKIKNIENCFLGVDCKYKIIPFDKILVDYMEIFDMYDTSTERESLSLDYISNKILNISKVKFDKNLTLMELYNNYYLEFLFYNVIDAFLVNLIHNRTFLLNILFHIAELTKTEFYRVNSAIKTIENVLLIEYFKKNKTIITLSESEKRENKKYSIVGGYVKEPIRGLYKKFAMFDFSSLYPNIIRQFNISPETYINEKIILNKENLIKTINKTYFKKEEGILKKIIDDFYHKRKNNQFIALEIEKEIKQLEKLL